MCPECGETMIILELEGIEIDYCVQCHGTWLDSGELELLAELEGAEPGPLSQALYAAKGKKPAERRCPRCRKKLDVIHIGENPQVELDRCPAGDGVWFDRGEVQQVICCFHEGEEGMVAKFFSELYHDEMNSQTKGE